MMLGGEEIYFLGGPSSPQEMLLMNLSLSLSSHLGGIVLARFAGSFVRGGGGEGSRREKNTSP